MPFSQKQRPMRKLLALFFVLAGVAFAQPNGILQPNSTMFPGQVTFSPDGRYHLNFQNDGNVVLYHDDRPIWAAQTNGTYPSELRMQPDGNFVLYGHGEAIWATNTAGNPGAQIRIQNDGNMVMYSVNQRVLWATKTYRR